jgi:hydrogenase maturation protease
MKTLVIGLGNPTLGDDGIGWRVAEAISACLGQRAAVEVGTASLRGLSLMERLTGYERIILVDAIFTGQKPVGTVSQYSLSELPELSAGHSSAAIDTSLRNALNIGRSMDIPLPQDKEVTIVAIEAENVYDFSEKLSPPVEAAIPLAAETVLNLLHT